MVLEIFSSLDPAVVKALITGLATSIGKVAAESGLKLFGQGGDKLLDGGNAEFGQNSTLSPELNA